MNTDTTMGWPETIKWLLAMLDPVENVYFKYARYVLEVIILSFLIYKVYEILMKTHAAQIIRTVCFLAGVFAAAKILHLPTMQFLLKMMLPGILVAAGLVFQPELRKLVMGLGFQDLLKSGAKSSLGRNLDPVVTAAEILSAMKRGLLVVFPRRNSIKQWMNGTELNADISADLIVAIFQCDGPLHDGAMIIQNGRILAAACHLPNSEQQNIRKSFGMRHRAALGMSEQTDAVVLVVSEESGAISIACDGEIYYDLPRRMIERKLRSLLDQKLRGADNSECNSADTERAKEVM